MGNGAQGPSGHRDRLKVPLSPARIPSLAFVLDLFVIEKLRTLNFEPQNVWVFGKTIPAFLSNALIFNIMKYVFEIFTFLLFLVFKLWIIPVFCPACFQQCAFTEAVQHSECPCPTLHMALLSWKYTPGSTDLLFCLAGYTHAVLLCCSAASLWGQLRPTYNLPGTPSEVRRQRNWVVTTGLLFSVILGDLLTWEYLFPHGRMCVYLSSLNRCNIWEV